MAMERKAVCFNLDVPDERAMYELAHEMNFSGWVKSQLKPLALARISQRVARGVGVPVPVRKAVTRDGK
ncbi:hypothetical protein T458_06985 [Brevibacillus panacihumi W25]|uniref:Uncharacterized protein n=1 Tax=Brevibacillus panacihumi W25 TaxID=1408254 RepID=V6MCR6_9BACL|nr:hypothetical protein [Brevibacillus panacihumi]EST55695.1 hypothetical protein T458_06985 [Brevibacillus panacihumi W25]